MRKLKRSECAVLPLVLKGKWYDKIASGEKYEEYRAITPYWTVRLANWNNADAKHHVVEFRLGYAKDAPRIALVGAWYTATDECRHPEWGEPDTLHYLIALGERVELEGGGGDTARLQRMAARRGTLRMDWRADREAELLPAVLPRPNRAGNRPRG